MWKEEPTMEQPTFLHYGLRPPDEIQAHDRLEDISQESSFALTADSLTSSRPYSSFRPARNSFADRLAARQSGSNFKSSFSSISSNISNFSPDCFTSPDDYPNRKASSNIVVSHLCIPPSRVLTPRAKVGGIPEAAFSPSGIESPILLSTNHAEPSPTTGTFPFHQFGFSSHWMTTGAGQGTTLGSDASKVHSTGPGFKPPVTADSNPAPSHESALEQRAEPTSRELALPCSDPTVTSSLAECSPPAPASHAATAGPGVDRPGDDGYSWRKYGQKVVRGCVLPKSYYKCTFAGCEVKKREYKSENGEVIEREYEGSHNHAKPLNARRVAITLPPHSSDVIKVLDEHRSCGGDMAHLKDEPLEESRAVNHSPFDSKRRRHSDDDSMEAGRKIVREPKLVLRTPSEVEILDDGFRWRKYGQKVVKGNPHPRSYYKCTNNGCSVRKHIERCGDDSRVVVTTYEGKHNHDIPANRGVRSELEVESYVTGGELVVREDSDRVGSDLCTSSDVEFGEEVEN